MRLRSLQSAGQSSAKRNRSVGGGSSIGSIDRFEISCPLPLGRPDLYRQLSAAFFSPLGLIRLASGELFGASLNAFAWASRSIPASAIQVLLRVRVDAGRR